MESPVISDSDLQFSFVRRRYQDNLMETFKIVNGFVGS